jgi:hypothetical protein
MSKQAIGLALILVVGWSALVLLKAQKQAEPASQANAAPVDEVSYPPPDAEHPHFGAVEARKSLRAARAFWNYAEPLGLGRRKYGCALGDVEVRWLQSKQMQSMRSTDTSVAGRAPMAGCRSGSKWIELNDKMRSGVDPLSQVKICVVIVHETGHLIGFKHASSDQNIMHSSHRTPHSKENGYLKASEAARAGVAYLYCINELGLS